MEAGIPYFNLDRLASNTMASHRLIQYLGKEYGLDVSEAIYDLLNVYYFVDGHALNDRPRLAKVVANELKGLIPQNPLTEEDILKFLNGAQGRKEIERALTAVRQFGISGIPLFIIEGKTVVDGAARSDRFIQVFREIEKRGMVHPGTVFGDILGVNKETVKRGSHRPPNHERA
jgi:predicted DsbA family dithiol-disulfide isomerase